MELNSFEPEEYLDAILGLFPKGAFWDDNLRPGDDLHTVAAIKAEELARIDGRAVSLVRESIPSLAAETLGEWERLTGLGEGWTFPEEVRRRRIVLRLMGLRLTRGHIEALAMLWGLKVIGVERPREFAMLKGRMGDPMWGLQGRALVIFQVEVPPITAAGDKNQFEEEVRGILSAYRHPQFVYVEKE